MTLNQSVSWRATSGTPNSGTVRFEPHEGGTHVFVTIEYELNPVEAVGDALTHAAVREVQQDLENFTYVAEMGEPVVGRRAENLAEQTGP